MPGRTGVNTGSFPVATLSAYEVRARSVPCRNRRPGRAARGPGRRRGPRALAMKIDHVWQHDASASLARLALALGDAPAALKHIEPQLSLREGGGNFDGT